jgi:hypothetical protein
MWWCRTVLTSAKNQPLAFQAVVSHFLTELFWLIMSGGEHLEKIFSTLLAENKSTFV